MKTIELGDADESAASVETADTLGRSELLRAALMEVVERHEPEVARLMKGEPLQGPMSTRLLSRTIQAQAIWFQLLSIAEENRDMRRRREVERVRGYDQVQGTFAHVFALAVEAGLDVAQGPRGAVQPARCVRSSPPTRPRPSGSRCWSAIGASTCACSTSSRRAGPSASARTCSARCATRSRSCG